MTLPDGTYRGTIDRIEEGIAVILIEDEQGDAADVVENAFPCAAIRFSISSKTSASS